MDNIDVKDELFTSWNSFPFCQACLSKDRVLSSVTEYVDIFYKICEFQDVDPPTEAFLCWECAAFMKRVKKFTKMVFDAQKILETYLSMQNPFPHSLSSLTITATKTELFTFAYEEKVKLIKDEPELNVYDHADNFDYATDDEKLDIKVDPESKDAEPASDLKVKSMSDMSTSNNDKKSFRKSEEFNTKRNLKRQAKYRFINTKLRKHRGYLIRKRSIEIEEAKAMLDRERCSSVFLLAEHKCVGCVEILDNEGELLNHNKKYHDVSLGNFSCHICQTRCLTPDALCSHVASHAVCKECRACSWRGVASGVVRRHVDEHHRTVQCIACGMFFKNVRVFYSHYKAMHSIYECDVCGKRCKSRDIIVRHLRYHFGFECPFCKKRLKNSSSYNNHLECQHTNSYPDNAYCVPCDRRFKSDRLYKRHLQASSAHAKERDNSRVKRKYPCPECSNVYSRRSYLNNHYRHVHSKESKFYCEDCDRHFLNRTRFVDHRRYKHEGAQRDKDKLCNICGRGFAANRTLINHIRTHSGERPFACSFCDAKFTQKHAMLSHVKYIHLKSKRKPAWHD